MKPVDSHCHLDFNRFDGDRDEVIQRSKESVEFVVNAGRNLETNRKIKKICEEHPDFILPNFGLHPTYTENFDEVTEIKKFIKNEEPPAVGEIGLDHHHIETEEMRERQREVFEKMLSIAEETEKPAVIHSREAEQEVFRTVQKYNLSGVMLHCFNGTPELAERAAGAGMKIGVTTQVLYSSRVQDIVKQIPLESIMLETDSPFLYRGERNEPRNVKESVEKISEILNVEDEEVIEKTNANSRELFCQN